MSLASKIHAIRAMALVVRKTGEIRGGINAPFASYADVWSTLEPALKEHGVSVGWQGAILRPSTGEDYIVSMTMEISDGSESRQHVFEMLVPEAIRNSSGRSVVNNAQRVANAESYCTRLSLVRFFGVAAGNEDECERMRPSDDHPGATRITENTRWQELTDGMWMDCMSPLHDGCTLGQYLKDQGEDGLRDLWQQCKDHPALCAFGADVLNSRMAASGVTWTQIKEAGADMPDKFHSCDWRQLREAFRAYAKLTK